MSSGVSILILFESFTFSAKKSVRGENAKIFEKKLYLDTDYMSYFHLRRFYAIFDNNLKKQFSGRNKHFDEKPSDTNLFLFFIFYLYKLFLPQLE